MLKKRNGARMPEFPKPDPLDDIQGVNVRLKRRLWDRLRKIAAEQDPELSMNDVVKHFLEWACDDYDKAKARKKGG